VWKGHQHLTVHVLQILECWHKNRQPKGVTHQPQSVNRGICEDIEEEGEEKKGVTGPFTFQLALQRQHTHLDKLLPPHDKVKIILKDFKETPQMNCDRWHCKRDWKAAPSHSKPTKPHSPHTALPLTHVNSLPPFSRRCGCGDLRKRIYFCPHHQVRAICVTGSCTLLFLHTINHLLNSTPYLSITPQRTLQFGDKHED